ncbi:hypothetical protein PI125_g2794 [Phytophthora idaei]|nr:hypothetical protein PI125_g2794 [Phytophthora idaei]KAG3169620.1 hypothetical protein PI126_g2723 [Phytophthora idaei]
MIGGAVNDNDDDLEQVAAAHRSLEIPVITTVKEALQWIAKPDAEKTGWIDLSITRFTKRKFERGWFLNLVDTKRARNFDATKTALESLPFSLKKKYMVSLALYLVPFNSKNDLWGPEVPFIEGSILRCVRIPKGNVSGLHRITDLAAAADGVGRVCGPVQNKVEPASLSTGTAQGSLLNAAATADGIDINSETTAVVPPVSESSEALPAECKPMKKTRQRNLSSSLQEPTTTIKAQKTKKS